MAKNSLTHHFIITTQLPLYVSPINSISQAQLIHLLPLISLNSKTLRRYPDFFWTFDPDLTHIH